VLREKRRAIAVSAAWLVLASAFPPVPRAAITLARNLPLFGAALRGVARGRLGAEVLDATAVGTATRMGDFRTAGVIGLLLGIGDYLRLRTTPRGRRRAPRAARTASPTGSCRTCSRRRGSPGS
jgi:hypothetical protein